jgi:hypothetical protein
MIDYKGGKALENMSDLPKNNFSRQEQEHRVRIWIVHPAILSLEQTIVSHHKSSFCKVACMFAMITVPEGEHQETPSSAMPTWERTRWKYILV